MTGPALVVMCRAPLPGRTKTRMQPQLTGEQCAALSGAFIRDATALAASMPQFARFLAYTPRRSEALFRKTVAPGTALLPQSGRNLGQRMFNLMRAIGTEGYSPVIIIGSDIPTLQPPALSRALDSLDRADVCLGPAHDGGYYLIGMRHASEAVFQNIPWSTPGTLEATLARARGSGLSVALLEECADIDTFEDLAWLASEIRRLEATPGALVPTHTRHWLEKELPGIRSTLETTDQHRHST